MFIQRTITGELLDMAKANPVVTITGPRQSGKTTLARNTFNSHEYFNLENPAVREQIQSDPLYFLQNTKNGAIIDEFQRYPELLSYIQADVDENKKSGRFILTGSKQYSMLDLISQSLAGRTSILKLLPFTMGEALKIDNDQSINHLLFKGFYPGVYSNDLPPNKAYRNYYETYIERDVRQLSNIQNLASFQLFIRLCAGRIGQVFNASSMSNEIGVSVPTIKHWLSILETSHIVYMLRPWHSNL